jgi:hypothetical protein
MAVRFAETSEALRVPRWRDAQTTRENARRRLNDSQLYRGRSKLPRSDRRYLTDLATRSERSGDHASAGAIRDLLELGPDLHDGEGR